MDESLCIEVWFAASPTEVFAAWSQPSQLAVWFAAFDWTVTEVEFAPVAGSAWRVVFSNPHGQRYTEAGVVREAIASKRLVLTHSQSGLGRSPSETVVSVDLEPEAGGTRMRFEQCGRFSGPSRDGNLAGWRHCFEQLTRLLDKAA